MTGKRDLIGRGIEIGRGRHRVSFSIQRYIKRWISGFLKVGVWRRGSGYNYGTVKPQGRYPVPATLTAYTMDFDDLCQAHKEGLV